MHARGLVQTRQPAIPIRWASGRAVQRALLSPALLGDQSKEDSLQTITCLVGFERRGVSSYCNRWPPSAQVPPTGPEGAAVVARTCRRSAVRNVSGCVPALASFTGIAILSRFGVPRPGSALEHTLTAGNDTCAFLKLPPLWPQMWKRSCWLTMT